MATVGYTVGWLEPDDAASIARVEAKVHEASQRAGERVIWAQLAETSADGRNLSIGLYRRGKLVGFALAFIARDRREIAEFFDASLPAELDADEPVFYVADIAVRPRHRRATLLLIRHLQRLAVAREDLRAFGFDAFSTREYAAIWTARARFFARFGWSLAAKHEFRDPRLGIEMYWLSFVRRNEHGAASGSSPAGVVKAQRVYGDGALTVGYVDSVLDWERLEPHWETLRARSPAAPLCESFAYLKRWWAHVGVLGELRILVALRHGLPVAIAPMELVRVPWLGRERRHLQFMSGKPEVEALSLLASPDDSEAAGAVADYIAKRADLWDGIVLDAQPSGDALIDPLVHSLERHGMLVATQPAARHVCFRLDDDVAVLLERHLRRLLPRAPALEFESVVAAETLEAALERFVELDEEVGNAGGTEWSGRQYAFYLDLARRQERAARLCFGYLESGGRDVAAIAALAGEASFVPLHVISRTPVADVEADACAPAGVTLHAHRRGVSGMLMHGVYSVIKPRIKRRLCGTA